MIDECVVCNSKNKKWQLLLSNSPDWNWIINSASKDRGDKLSVVVGDYLQNTSLVNIKSPQEINKRESHLKSCQKTGRLIQTSQKQLQPDVLTNGTCAF